ncbi:MAG: N-acetyltransferase [Actinomycetota bacterium]|nr:MAG: N-acetyltransferase [Actinomycetota bacterium]
MIVGDRYAWAVDHLATSARLRAGTVVDVGPAGFVVSDPTVRRSHERNRLVWTGPAGGPGASAADLHRHAARLLGAAGVGHREIHVLGPVEPPVVAEFAALRYAHDEQSLLAAGSPYDLRRANELHPAAGWTTELLAEPAVAEFAAQLWRTEYAVGIAEDEIDELVAGRLRALRSGTMTSVGVRGPDGDVVAAADLLGRNGVAELDAVAVDRHWRGRGLGDALLTAALQRAQDAGYRDVLLLALADDWPAAWYLRRGFVRLGPVHAFTAVAG